VISPLGWLKAEARRAEKISRYPSDPSGHLSGPGYEDKCPAGRGRRSDDNIARRQPSRAGAVDPTIQAVIPRRWKVDGLRDVGNTWSRCCAGAVEVDHSPGTCTRSGYTLPVH
jgi:hypothetical protein